MIYKTETRDGATGALVERDVYDTTAGTLTVFGPTGAQVSQRALTAAEATALAAADTAQTTASNQATIQTQAANALATNTTFLALGAPTNADVVAQVKALTRQNNALIRLALGKFDATS